MDTCRSAVGMELVIAFVQLISSSHACTLSLVKPYQDFDLPLSYNPLSLAKLASNCRYKMATELNNQTKRDKLVVIERG